MIMLIMALSSERETNVKNSTFSIDGGTAANDASIRAYLDMKRSEGRGEITLNCCASAQGNHLPGCENA